MQSFSFLNLLAQNNTFVSNLFPYLDCELKELCFKNLRARRRGRVQNTVNMWILWSLMMIAPSLVTSYFHVQMSIHWNMIPML